VEVTKGAHAGFSFLGKEFWSHLLALTTNGRTTSVKQRSPTWLILEQILDDVWGGLIYRRRRRGVKCDLIVKPHQTKG